LISIMTNTRPRRSSSDGNNVCNVSPGDGSGSSGISTDIPHVLLLTAIIDCSVVVGDSAARDLIWPTKMNRKYKEVCTLANKDLEA
jgi:hypothetical protein